MSRYQSLLQAPTWLSRFQASSSTIFRPRYLIIGGIATIFLSTLLFFGAHDDYRFFRNGGAFHKKPFQQCTLSDRLSSPGTSDDVEVSWEFSASRDADNYALSSEQCMHAFPKLFLEIDKSVLLRREANNPITFDEMSARKQLGQGMARAIIDRGDLYIIDYGDMRYTQSRARATLHSIHRALVSMPDRSHLPSVEFVFTSDDFVNEDLKDKGPVWAYAKRDEDDTIWLMPDFGYWAWPEVQVGPYAQVRRRIAAVDEEMPDFASKKKQLVWRGSLKTAPEIRGNLLKYTRGKHWASVHVLDWESEDDVRLNLLPLEDHCRYMFTAHAEGRSFSGRGKYLLNCRSTLVTHQVRWREAHTAALIASGPDANYVEVERDFSDLESKVEYLLDHPDVAERIANNSVTTFRDRYLTPAAEACYWRYLIAQYAQVCNFVPTVYATDADGRKKLRGVPFEEWVLTGLT